MGEGTTGPKHGARHGIYGEREHETLLVGDGGRVDGAEQSHLRIDDKREELSLLDPQLGQWRLVSGALGERPPD